MWLKSKSIIADYINERRELHAWPIQEKCNGEDAMNFIWTNTWCGNNVWGNPGIAKPCPAKKHATIIVTN